MQVSSCVAKAQRKPVQRPQVLGRRGRWTNYEDSKYSAEACGAGVHINLVGTFREDSAFMRKLR